MKPKEMRRVSAKGQITLPAHQCRLAGIEPGEQYRSFAFDGCITIIRQKPGSAWGCLADLEPDETVCDEQSRQDSVSAKRANSS